MLSRLLLSVSLLTVCILSAPAQEVSSSPTYQLLMSPSFSFGGFNGEVGIERAHRSHRIGLAYRSILSESRFFGRAEHGLSLRYSRTLIEQGRLSAALIGRIMQGFGEGGDRQGEYLLGQEMTLALGERFHLDLTMAAGMYEETVKNNRYGIVVYDFGASGSVGLGIRFSLKGQGS